MTKKQEPQLDTHSRSPGWNPQHPNRYKTIQPTVLFVSSLQLSISHNDFTVHRSNSDLYLTTEGKAFDLQSRIDFFDDDGQKVLHLRKAMIGPKARWIGESSSGESMFKIERQLSCKSIVSTSGAFPVTSLSYSYTGPRTSHTCTIDSEGFTRTTWNMKGNWSGNSAKIEVSDRALPGSLLFICDLILPPIV